jgi:virginiamycin B lyase
MEMRTFGIAGIAMAGVLWALASPRNRAQSDYGAELKWTIREWTVPTKGAHPDGAALSPDGSFWFSEEMSNKLGRLDPKTGKIKEYLIGKRKNGDPRGVAADELGNIWFTADSVGAIGKLVPDTGNIIEYKMPRQHAGEAHTVVFDASGVLWFTVPDRDIVGRLNPRTGQIVLKQVPTEGALPDGIQVGASNTLVFCELGTNKIAVIKPESLDITEYTLPESVRPRRLALAGQDRVYFTDSQGGNLGVLNMITGSVRMYRSPGGPNSIPFGIVITHDGMVWYSESNSPPGTIVRFDPNAETFARIEIPSCGGGVRDLTATSDGRIYVACSGTDKVGVVEQTL